MVVSRCPGLVAFGLLYLLPLVFNLPRALDWGGAGCRRLLWPPGVHDLHGGMEGHSRWEAGTGVGSLTAPLHCLTHSPFPPRALQEPPSPSPEGPPSCIRGTLAPRAFRALAGSGRVHGGLGRLNKTM